MELVIDSTYKPLSFQELILPFVEYKKDYEKIEEDYSNLVALTEAWRNIANREKSPEAFEMFSRYANQLNAIVDDFSQGMNPRNRSQLLAMKRGYASNILPIAQAAEAMKQANALRDEKGPDAIFEEGRYDSIDRFLNGQVANNKYESRKDISARTAAIAQATAQSILEDPIIKNSMSPQFLEIIQKRGLGSMDELAQAIAGNPAASNRFALIRNQMIEQVGGLDRFDASGRRAIEEAINEGLYAGLNNYQTSLQANGEYMTTAQRLSHSLQQQSLNEQRAARKDAANAAKPRAVIGADGKPTGDYYDPKINMVVDKDGNIKGDPTKVGTGKGVSSGISTDPSTMNTTQLKAFHKRVSKPLYFDAGGGHGDSAHREANYSSWLGGSTEGYEHGFSLLHGQGKTRALNYIGDLLGLSNYATTYEKSTPALREVIDKILEKNVSVFRDLDWLSDNHFAVYLKGADHLNPGEPYDEPQLEASWAALQVLRGTGEAQDQLPGKKKE